MLAIRRLIGRMLAVALVTASTLLVPAAGQTSAGPTQRSPALTLEPSEGPPGTRVTATGDGYDDCFPTVDDVELTVPEGPGRLSLSKPATQPTQSTSGEVSLTWDSRRLATAVIDGGTFSATFLAPDSASLDTIYVVRGQCADDADVVASAEFSVIRPVEVPVVVPNLVGTTIGEAHAALEDAGLALGQASGTGDVIRRQDPTAGTEVSPGTAIDVSLATEEPDLVVVPDLVDTSLNDAPGVLEPLGLLLGSVSGDGKVIRSQSPLPETEVRRGTGVDVTVGSSAPRLVTVPDVVGSSVDDAPGILESTGLVLGQVAGSGDVIRGQNPATGARVPRGSAVNVTVQATVPPEQPVEVPDLVNGTVDDARAALEDVGLALGNDSGSGRAVERQEPAAGTLVPAGTEITVTPATVPVSERTPVWVVAAALILLGAALLIPRSVRARRRPSWVRTHVRVVARTGPARDVKFTQSLADPSTPTCVVRLEPHADGGKQVLVEVDP